MAANVSQDTASGTSDAESQQHWNLGMAERVLFAVSCALLCLVVQATNAGIVYYERVVSDAHRTLLNKLAALISVYQATFASFLYSVMAIRFFLDAGLWEPACWALMWSVSIWKTEAAATATTAAAVFLVSFSETSSKCSGTSTIATTTITVMLVTNLQT